MRDRAWFSLCSPADPCSVTFSTGDDTASSTRIRFSASTRPRPARQQRDHRLRLHDPYGPPLSFSEFAHLVRHSLHEPPTPSQNQEASQATTRNLRNRWGLYLQLIRLTFSLLQMGLPSIYFQRVAIVIQKSEITIADFAAIQPRGRSQGFLGMITLAGGVNVPNINTIQSFKRFKMKWRTFVVRCREEWGNLNLIGTLIMR